MKGQHFQNAKEIARVIVVFDPEYETWSSEKLWQATECVSCIPSS